MLNKKGQGLPTSTIILLILGVVVLVILVLGFTIGWNKILPFISTNNVDTIVNQCQASCSTNDVYGYCSLGRTLVASDLPNNQKQITANCSFLSTSADYVKYAVAKCPGLCPSS